MPANVQSCIKNLSAASHQKAARVSNCIVLLGSLSACRTRSPEVLPLRCAFGLGLHSNISKAQTLNDSAE
jgi:hypothetical protein